MVITKVYTVCYQHCEGTYHEMVIIVIVTIILYIYWLLRKLIILSH